MRTKDYKRAAGGDFDEDINLMSLKPEADEGAKLEVQHERGEVIQEAAGNIEGHPNEPLIKTKLLRKKSQPLPSDKTWFFEMRKFLSDCTLRLNSKRTSK